MKVERLNFSSTKNSVPWLFLSLPFRSVFHLFITSRHSTSRHVRSKSVEDVCTTSSVRKPSSIDLRAAGLPYQNIKILNSSVRAPPPRTWRSPFASERDLSIANHGVIHLKRDRESRETDRQRKKRESEEERESVSKWMRSMIHIEGKHCETRTCFPTNSIQRNGQNRKSTC